MKKSVKLSPFKLPCIIIGHQLLLRLKIMSLLEPFDEKSARQRASFLVLLSDRLECDEFIVQLGEYIGNAPKLVQKVFLFFFHSTLHAELDETKHAFNFLALRIFENLITKASFFVFLQQIGS